MRGRRVLDHFMPRKQPEVTSLISRLVRWRLRSKVEVVGETKFHLCRNEEKATANNALA